MYLYGRKKNGSQNSQPGQKPGGQTDNQTGTSDEHGAAGSEECIEAAKELFGKHIGTDSFVNPPVYINLAENIHIGKML